MDGVADRPVILVKRLFTRLMDALESFLASNQIVKVLALEALPIQGFHMATFVKVRFSRDDRKRSKHRRPKP